MTKETLKLALEALEQTLETLDDENAKPGGAIADIIWYSEHITLFDYLASGITAIKAALAQPAQEPVAWMSPHMKDRDGDWVYDFSMYRDDYYMFPVYKAPPQRPWVDLTEQERNDIEDNFEVVVSKHVFDAIEAKLKEKNT
jgi:hypothetical protein